MLCATTEITRNSGELFVALPNNDTFVASAVHNGATPDAVVAAPIPATIKKSGVAGKPCANDALALLANDAIVLLSINAPNSAILSLLVISTFY
jgi:hypothetical protein